MDAPPFYGRLYRLAVPTSTAEESACFMGLSNGNTALVLMAMRNAVSRDAVATIGKQLFWPSRRFLQRSLAATGSALDAERVFSSVGPKRDGSAFLKLLGVRHVDEVDASDYEGASIVHDMNQPLPSQYHQRYDVVYDGGSMEHIFDVRQVLENIGNMLKIGGLYVVTTSANNLLGHGFYQFSPEFFYRYLCPENGWGSTAVFLCEHQKDPPGFWYVEDPRSTGGRIQVQTPSQLNILVVSEKTATPPSFTTPQQSDYVVAWSGRAPQMGSTSPRPFPLVHAGKHLLKRIGLHRLQPWLQRRQGFPGLKQPGIHPLSTEAFVNYSMRTRDVSQPARSAAPQPNGFATPSA